MKLEVVDSDEGVVIGRWRLKEMIKNEELPERDMHGRCILEHVEKLRKKINSTPAGPARTQHAKAQRAYHKELLAWSVTRLEAEKVREHVTAAVAAGVESGNAHVTTEVDRAVAPLASAMGQVGEIHSQLVGDDRAPGETSQAYTGRLRIQQRLLQNKVNALKEEKKLSEARVAHEDRVAATREALRMEGLTEETVAKFIRKDDALEAATTKIRSEQKEVERTEKERQKAVERTEKERQKERAAAIAKLMKAIPKAEAALAIAQGNVRTAREKQPPARAATPMYVCGVRSWTGARLRKQGDVEQGVGAMKQQTIEMQGADEQRVVSIKKTEDYHLRWRMEEEDKLWEREIEGQRLANEAAEEAEAKMDLRLIQVAEEEQTQAVAPPEARKDLRLIQFAEEEEGKLSRKLMNVRAQLKSSKTRGGYSRDLQENEIEEGVSEPTIRPRGRVGINYYSTGAF